MSCSDYRLALGDSKVPPGRYSGAQEPAWSPDASRIALASGAGIQIVEADGSGLTILAGTRGTYSGGRFPSAPSGHSWSPDGSRIAFANQASGAYDVWVVNPDGSCLTAVTAQTHVSAWDFEAENGRALIAAVIALLLFALASSLAVGSWIAARLRFFKRTGIGLAVVYIVAALSLTVFSHGI